MKQQCPILFYKDMIIVNFSFYNEIYQTIHMNCGWNALKVTIKQTLT
ncbi:hypothetical protein [Staphylococcus felis]|nr:hypothetical protein [Staphylococcus felis]